jgi:hypothetical protein
MQATGEHSGRRKLDFAVYDEASSTWGVRQMTQESYNIMMRKSSDSDLEGSRSRKSAAGGSSSGRHNEGGDELVPSAKEWEKKAAKKQRVG